MKKQHCQHCRKNELKIIVKLTNVHEGRVVPESQEPDPHPVQDVDHAGDARVLPERHDPLTLGVHHGLIIHTPIILYVNCQYHQC